MDFLFQTGQFRTIFAKTVWAWMLNEIKAHCCASKLMARDVTPKDTKGNKENNIKKATGSEKTPRNTQPPSLQYTEKSLRNSKVPKCNGWTPSSVRFNKALTKAAMLHPLSVQGTSLISGTFLPSDRRYRWMPLMRIKRAKCHSG